MPTTQVIDLSHWNIIPYSLVEASQFGVLGVIHKATEGMGGLDAKCRARWSLTRDAGMLWGMYHFLRPGNMADQAAHFLNMTEGYWDLDTLLACDYEDDRIGLGAMLEFMEALQHLSGHSPVLYSGHTLKDQLLDGPGPDVLYDYRLWLAQYAAEPVLPQGYEEYWLWQYSDTGAVPGVNPPTDLNHYQHGDMRLQIEWASSNLRST